MNTDEHRFQNRELILIRVYRVFIAFICVMGFYSYG
jgi:hypothetical protein